MRSGPVQPSIKETAFSCPHCGVLTTQHWHEGYADEVGGERKLPFLPSAEDLQMLRGDKNLDQAKRSRLVRAVEKIVNRQVFMEKRKDALYGSNRVENVNFSECYNCHKVAIWVGDSLVYPPVKASTSPNPDLGDEILRDYEEARSIVSLSPRGAAALLRLCIQKLCVQLGGTGKNLDEDIGKLVKQGLNPLVQQSLDVVRVIGNEAVHPGSLDLKDDTDTATRLFGIVNAIADQMISHPKRVREMYEALPEEKRKAIEGRDASKK